MAYFEDKSEGGDSHNFNFPAGNSIQKRGRPSVSEEYREARKMITSDFTRLVKHLWFTDSNIEPKGMDSYGVKLMKSLFEKASEGSILHQKLILDRVLGSCPDSIPLDNPKDSKGNLLSAEFTLDEMTLAIRTIRKMKETGWKLMETPPQASSELQVQSSPPESPTE